MCDDCSSDKTVEILDEYKEKYGLKYYINEKNLKSLCQGDYIALSNQDDIWIELLVKKIGDSSLIHSACSLIDENSKVISSLWILNIRLQSSYLGIQLQDVQYFLKKNC